MFDSTIGELSEIGAVNASEVETVVAVEDNKLSSLVGDLVFLVLGGIIIIELFKLELKGIK